MLTDPLSGGACRWQATIDAHPLESNDPAEWLAYGVALLQTIQPGPSAPKQLQQAGLAFVQARNHGASEETVAAAQRYSVVQSLCSALELMSIEIPVQPACFACMPRAFQSSPDPGLRESAEPADPFSGMLKTMARKFELDLPEDASTLDQLLFAKMELRQRRVETAHVQQVLRDSIPRAAENRDELLQKFLLILL